MPTQRKPGEANGGDATVTSALRVRKVPRCLLWTCDAFKQAFADKKLSFFFLNYRSEGTVPLRIHPSSLAHVKAIWVFLKKKTT